MKIRSLLSQSRATGVASLFLAALALCGSPKAAAQDDAPLALAQGDDLAAAKPAVGNDYRITSSDVLEVAVFQEPDLKSVLRVSNQGTIDFPLIGIVQVGAQTTQEAARAIGQRLAKGYLMNPQVTVTVLEFSKRRFTVLGEVQKPGSYAMADDEPEVTLLQAIAMAGGYTRIANPGKVTLMRKTDLKPQIYEFNARKMANGSMQSAVMVLPGDVITVAESRF